ncbi:MAG TPA: electron transport complex subunit RsxD, partial [Gammaproteobacteria bacterium]|nr:electron transport complex subunit RsxD [Gammaproteobacteria bacterium]
PATVSPLFQLCHGGTFIAAFFIATDPVSSSTTQRGRLIYGLGVGLLAYLI